MYQPKHSNPFIKGMLYQKLLLNIGTDAQGRGGVNKNPWLLPGAGMDSKAVGCRIPSPGEGINSQIFSFQIFTKPHSWSFCGSSVQSDMAVGENPAPYPYPPPNSEQLELQSKREDNTQCCPLPSFPACLSGKPGIPQPVPNPTFYTVKK